MIAEFAVLLALATGIALGLVAMWRKLKNMTDPR